MNKVILTGRLVEETELKMTKSDRGFCQNVLAVKKDYKDANGETVTNFIKVIFWGQTAKFICDYAKKGDLIGVVGSWENRTYDKTDGTKGYISECIVEKAEILSKATQTKEDPRANEDPFSQFNQEPHFGIDNGDLPF